MKGSRNKSLEDCESSKTKTDDINNEVLTWYLNKINEMNLKYYEGESKNIIVQYPTNHTSFICISNQVRNTDEKDLLNDIACIFSSVECLNRLKKSDLMFRHGVRLIINPTSKSYNVKPIPSDDLFCYFEIKIVDIEILMKANSIGIVRKLISKDGKCVQCLSKSLQKIMEISIAKLGYNYHFIESYIIDDFKYLPKDVPIGFVLFPVSEKIDYQQNKEISHINIEKISKLLLNTIKKLNE